MKNINFSNLNNVKLSPKDKVKRHSNIDIWKAVVNNKRLVTRNKLLAIEDDIRQRYEFYERHYNNLNLIKPVTEVNIIENRDRLIDCYRNNVILKQIKKNLFQNQQYCPYCMINTANTVDHYFDKTTYPEYSIFIPNLIPCCSKCNTDKDNKMFSTDGTRQFIHFYFDDLPTTQFLFIRFMVIPGFDYPTIDIFVDFNPSQTNSEIIIRNHLQELNIIDMYKRIINEKLSVFIQECMKSSRRAVPLDQFKGMVSIRYESLIATYGVNHWESCMYEGYLNSENFIETYYTDNSPITN